MTTEKIGIYVHIPFCRQKCLYCDFPSSAGQEDLFASYTRALVREITSQGVNFSHLLVDTLFIGGGTPTLLPLPLLLDICRALRESFRLTPDCEWSIEANPGTVDAAKLIELRRCGVNRLSFGVQSFDDGVLKKIGRIHTARQAACSIANFTATLEQALALPIKHLSVYSLQVETGTAFAAAQQAGKLLLPDETIEAAVDELVVNRLPEQGFSRYEISNYAQSGYQCRHNLKYWRYQAYLGLGAAACSFVTGRRQTNIRSVETYIQAIKTGQSTVAVVESLTEEVRRGEMIFLALRTTAGLLFADYYEHFHRNFVQDYENILNKLCKQRLLDWNQQGIKLTELGLKFGNVVFCEFLP